MKTSIGDKSVVEHEDSQFGERRRPDIGKTEDEKELFRAEHDLLVDS